MNSSPRNSLAGLDGLSRLLATENISVEHRKVKTAFFDLKTRLLVCPILKDDTPRSIYTMFHAHEVGHARETPTDKWFEYLRCFPKRKDYINVLEDVRIERKVKDTYPGLRKDFFEGYKLFFADVGVPVDKVPTMSLLDRINLFYKVGAFVTVPFSATERAILKRIDAMRTWDNAVTLANEIFELDRAALEKKKQQQPPPRPKNLGQPGDADVDGESCEEGETSNDTGDAGDDDGDFDGGWTKGTSSDNDDAEDGEKLAEGDDSTEGDSGEDSPGSSDDNSPNSGDADGDSDNDFGGDAMSNTGGPDSTDGNDTDGVNENINGDLYKDGPESLTDGKFAESQAKYVDDSTSGDFNYHDWPDVDLEQIIIPFKRLYGSVEFTRRTWNTHSSTTPTGNTYAQKFRSDNNRYISHLTKEFELKKNAWQYARTRESKTGALNMQKLYQYKFSDNIFKSTTIVPKGKNHGLVMFVDLSGSMNSTLKNVMQQAIALAYFCRKSGLPFRVYGFSNNALFAKHFPEMMERPQIRSTVKDGFNWVKHGGYLFLLELLSDRMTTSDMEIATNYLLSGNLHSWLHFTPLNETILCIPKIVELIRNQYGIQTLSVMILSDGETDQDVFSHNSYGRYLIKYGKKSYVLKENVKYPAVSKYGTGSNAETSGLLKAIKDITKVNLIGYFIIPDSRQRMRNTLYSLLKYTSDPFVENHTDRIKKQGFTNLDLYGYDKYFLLKASGMYMNATGSIAGVDRGDILDKRGRVSTTKLAKVFTGVQNTRKVNVTFVKEFMEELTANE